MILVEAKAQAVDVSIITRTGETTREDRPLPQVRLVGKRKKTFDITTEKETFFQEKHAIGRNLCKLPIVEMTFAFDPSIEAGPLRQHGTLQ